MKYKIEFSYSPHFLSSTARTFWLRDMGTSYFIFIGVPLCAFVLCLASGEFASSHAGNFLLGFLLGITATIGFLFGYQLLSFQKSAETAARKWHGVTVAYEFTDDGITADSTLVSGNYTWKMVEKLRQTPKAWLLVFNEQDFIALPSELLSEELKQFLTRKVVEVGGKAV